VVKLKAGISHSGPLSGYRGMWLFALFDLPVKSKEQRKRYTRFRKTLIKAGFMMLQYSVYAQYCTSEEASEAKRRRVREELPDEGQVRLVSITDKQFGSMEVFLGKREGVPEEEPRQLTFF
jgi:CRISPR-associated protein Cas2